MDIRTVVRNVYVTLLFVVATAAVVSIQMSPVSQDGGSLFFWFLYVVGLSWALVVLLVSGRAP